MVCLSYLMIKMAVILKLNKPMAFKHGDDVIHLKFPQRWYNFLIICKNWDNMCYLSSIVPPLSAKNSINKGSVKIAPLVLFLQNSTARARARARTVKKNVLRDIYIRRGVKLTLALTFPSFPKSFRLLAQLKNSII